MLKRCTPTLSPLQSIVVWVGLVVFGILIWNVFLNQYAPATPVAATQAPVRFIACNSLAGVLGIQAGTAIGGGLIVALLAETLFARRLSSKARVGAFIAMSTLLFVVSASSVLLLRNRFVGVCS